MIIFIYYYALPPGFTSSAEGPGPDSEDPRSARKDRHGTEGWHHRRTGNYNLTIPVPKFKIKQKNSQAGNFKTLLTQKTGQFVYSCLFN